MKRLLYSVLLVAAGAVVYHYVGPELPTNFQLAELSSPGGLLQTVKGKQFELVSHERNLYRLDTFSGQTWVLTGNQWEPIQNSDAAPASEN